MRPGRDLDLLVIEKVMGWKYDPARTFSPSNNLFHAWEMEECVTRDADLRQTYGEALLELAVGVHAKDMEPSELAILLSHASPHARCLAALRAVGATIPDAIAS